MYNLTSTFHSSPFRIVHTSPFFPSEIFVSVTVNTKTIDLCSLLHVQCKESSTSIHKMLKRRYFIFSLSFEQSRLGHEPKTYHVLKFHVNVKFHEIEAKNQLKLNYIHFYI